MSTSAQSSTGVADEKSEFLIEAVLEHAPSQHATIPGVVAVTGVSSDNNLGLDNNNNKSE